MTGTASPYHAAGAEAAEHLVVVFQFGKVASTAMVDALNDHPGIEAVQSHFLGEGALQSIFASILNPALSEYFFFHQSGQLFENVKLTRRIGRILSGEDNGTHLSVLLTVREPIDWLRSALIQDARGLGDVFLRTKDRHGLVGDTLGAIVQPAVEAILGEIVEVLTPFGSVDSFLAGRPGSMAQMREQITDPSLQELFYAAVRPFNWYTLNFDPVFHHTLDDLSYQNGLWSLRAERFDAHLFRYEDMGAQLSNVAAALSIEDLVLPQRNVSEGKVFSAEIRAAFRSANAQSLARLYAETDYSRRFGYDPVASALGRPSVRTAPEIGPATTPLDTATVPSLAQTGKPEVKHQSAASILVCPSCRSASLPACDETMICPACAAAFPKLGTMRDLRKDRGADTALDLESYDAHHDVTLATAETLFRHYEARLHSLGPGTKGRALEIGAGTGNLTLGLAQKAEFSELWITDLSPRFLERLVDRIATTGSIERIKPCLLDANALPFLDGSFDVIVGHSVLHHLLDFETTLRDTYRCLRPGGAAMFGDPMMDSQAIMFMIARQILTLAEDGVGPQVSDGTRQVLEIIAQRGGIKSANLRDRDARVLAHEDKYVFPTGFLRDLCQDIGFSHVAIRSLPGHRDLGGDMRRNFLGTVRGTQARIEDLDPYLPLFDAVTTAYTPGMGDYSLSLFAYLELVK